MNKSNKSEFNDFISENMTIDGSLVSKGSTHIFGSINGNINGNVVVIGKLGSIQGEIKAKMVSIEGSFNGTIIAENLEIKSGSLVEGEIMYQSICIEHGSILKAKIKRIDSK